MSVITDQLHDLLSQEFEYTRNEIYEFGWCNIIDAEDRLTNRSVRLYAAKSDVLANSAAKKKIAAQFKAYEQTSQHECLPEAVDLLEGKKAKGNLVLVTDRTRYANLLQAERGGEGSSWLDADKFSHPQKLGAVTKFVDALRVLHGLGLVQGSLGQQTLGVASKDDRLLLFVDILNFGDMASADPAASLMFEPAFTAPELFETGGEEEVVAVRNKTSDVYSAGKYLIYFLLGPVGFLEFFTGSSKNKVRDAAGLFDKLTDHDLWQNLATKKADLNPGKLEKLSNDKVSSEMAEFLTYMVGWEPSARPADGDVVSHGFSTILGGEVPSAEDYTIAPVRVEKDDDNNTMMMLGALAASMILIFGMWYWWDTQNKKRALEEQYAATDVSCSGFFGELANLEESAISGFSTWPEVLQLRDQVKQNGDAKETLAETQSLCDAGMTGINNAKFGFIQGLNAEISEAIELGGEEGADFSALDVETRIEAAAASEAERLFAETEAQLVPLAQDLQSARMLVQEGALNAGLADLSAGRDLLNINEMPDDDIAFASQVETLLGAEPAAQGIANAKSLDAQMRAFNLQRLGQGLLLRIEDLNTNAGALASEDVAEVFPEFSKANTEISSLQSAELPVDFLGFANAFASVENVESILKLSEDHLQNLAGETPNLVTAIAEQIEAATSRGWEDFPPIAEQATRFSMRSDLSVAKEWMLLNDIKGRLLDAVAQREEIERFKAEADQQRRNAIESIAEAENAGIGDFIEELVMAKESAAALSALQLPETQPDFTEFQDQAIEVINLSESAAVRFSDALALEETLKSSFGALFQEISETPLARHPDFKTLISGFSQEEPPHVLASVAMLKQNISSLQLLKTKFDKGDLLNCSFADGLEMTPVKLDGAVIASMAEAIRSEGRKSDVEVRFQGEKLASFCLSEKLVSLRDLQRFGETLKRRQKDVKTEIEKAQTGPDGAAVNISYWLASRYVDWLNTQNEQTVCIAPAAATVASASVGNVSTAGIGELHTDKCGKESVGNRNLLVSANGADLSVGCLSSSSVVSNVGFRLAGGGVCE